MKRATEAIANIYLTVRRRATVEQMRVDEIATSVLENGLQTPTRLVLVSGLSLPPRGLQSARREDDRGLSLSRRGNISSRR